MIISVGSTNPTKVDAVKRVVKKLFSDCEVKGVIVSSKVNDMPLTDEETIQGAKNRALNALGKSNYGVGIEGGVNDTTHGMFLCAWIAVTDGIKTGLSCTGKILIPKDIATELRNGKELGPLMSERTGVEKVNHHEGTFGLLTNGLIKPSLENSYVR